MAGGDSASPGELTALMQDVTAKSALYLSGHDTLPIALDFAGTADVVRTMLRLSLDALATANTTLAREVLAMDDQVDAAKKDASVRLRSLMRQDPGTIERALHAMSVFRHLERIGDMATNMAEDVVYMVEGDIIRHRSDDGEDAARQTTDRPGD